MLKKEIKRTQKNLSTYRSDNTGYILSYADPNVTSSKTLSDKINEHFPGKCKATSIVIEDM